MISCIIIEDTLSEAEKLKEYASRLPFLNLLRVFNSGIDAIRFLKTNEVDLVFLDIEMKDLSTIHLPGAISAKSRIIVITQDKEIVIEDYEKQVSGYLLKHVKFEQFTEACDKVNILLYRQKYSNSKTKIHVKTEYRQESVEVSRILYIEAMGEHRRVVSEKKKIMTLQTFDELIKILPADRFFRVHNLYIVAVEKIDSIEKNRIRIGDALIPVGSKRRDSFYKKIGNQ